MRACLRHLVLTQPWSRARICVRQMGEYIANIEVRFDINLTIMRIFQMVTYLIFLAHLLGALAASPRVRSHRAPPRAPLPPAPTQTDPRGSLFLCHRIRPREAGASAVTLPLLPPQAASGST